ncbi:diaminopimelate decarboxylase [Bifidobacterium samirii]|uniref:Diaminopimelate decarboxylase n=2 Tax=Bifidobacterium samirii TaxID=2306974 RepID=A0A430FW94_9BIFI|nr:diaminopimelate decarboxylase [Bifidobacterium samirii]
MDGWAIELGFIEDWLDEQDDKTIRLVMAAVNMLRREGPNLRRPLVGTIDGSAYRNMKELIPASSGNAQIRILFMFDRSRTAVLLLAGDKRKRWDSWYRTAIPEAERRYAQYLHERSARA